MKRIELKKGFTLLEMLVVIGLLGIVASMSLFMDINGYRGDAFRSEVSKVGVALQTARADALNNINQKKHGVAINGDEYVIFEGSTYATRDVSKDQIIKSSYKVTFSPTSPAEIIFEQLSGNANYDGDITMVDMERNLSAIISINYEGKISW